MKRLIPAWCILIFVLSGCASSRSDGVAPVPFIINYESFQFSSTVSYTTALREVTDVGTQPDLPCSFPARSVSHQPLWVPLGQEQSFARTHRLILSLTTLANPTLDWGAVGRLPGVLPSPSNSALSLFATCTPVIGTPGPHVSIPYPATWPEPYSRVVFTAGTDYSTALMAISDPGLRLANPCYEKALNAGQLVTWRLMGQEATFAHTHTLVVGISHDITSSLWQQQLRANPAVSAIQTPYLATC